MDGYALAQKVFASEFNIGGVSVRITVVYWMVFVAIATWILLRTKVAATAGSTRSAVTPSACSGVPVAKTKIGLFMGVGFLAWFSGMHLLFASTARAVRRGRRQRVHLHHRGRDWRLLTGGYGTAVGAAISAPSSAGMTNQGIVYAGWNPDWVKFFLGVMLLLATVTPTSRSNQASRR